VALFPEPDFVLLHPPSVYDFRRKLIIPSPIADLIPSGPFFDMYPIGFSFLGEYLERHGINVRIVNLAARMLEKPGFDVEKSIGRLRPLAFGIDLHWLPHCQGAIEISRLCKRIHPGIPVVIGGYSATLFSRELMGYPEIDYVVRGDSTEEPLRRLLSAIASNNSLDGIPNLTYRDPDSGCVVENPLAYVPDDLVHLGNNYLYMLRSALKYRDIWALRAFKDWWSYPMTAVLTCRGCRNNCCFCGGSAVTMDNCFKRRQPAFRSPERVIEDVRTISAFTGAPVFVIGDIRHGGDQYAGRILDGLARVAAKNLTVLELFKPAPREFFQRLSECIPNYALEISPESHDERVRLATGKMYMNEDLEQSIEWALESGCSKIDVFFMIGLPGQTAQSVHDTVGYCERLLEKFGPSLNPLVGPLAPFLDPFSIAHSNPGEYGYRVLINSLEEYRNALLNPHWREMLSYETRWMSRQEIVDSTYTALLELNRMKGRFGLVSPDFMEKMDRFLLDNMALLDRLDRAMSIDDAAVRGEELSIIKREADLLQSRSYLVKEEIKWPVSSRRFRYFNILRLLAGEARRKTPRPEDRRR